MNYFIYARKSTEDDGRQVQSIPDQIKTAKKIAESKGLQVIEVIQESKSASSPGRPEFNNMLRRITEGVAQGIICWKLDRLARNPVDGGNVTWMLQQGTIQHILTNDGDFFPNSNILPLYLQFGMANQFSLDLSVNTKRGMKFRCNNGWLPGVAPLGYLNNKNDDGTPPIIADEERFRLVRKMWEMMLTDAYSLKGICQLANEKWGFTTRARRKRQSGPIGISTLYGIFTNPFYYGEFDWDGETYQGKHKPMITRSEFDHVQKILRRKGKPRPQKKKFAYTGLIKCGECGYMITAQENTKFIKATKQIRKYTYYSCTRKSRTMRCTQKSTNQDKLEEQIRSFLKTVQISEIHIDWIIKYLHEFNEYDVDDRDKIREGLQKRLDQQTKQLDSLIRLKIRGDEYLTDDEFKTQKEQLTKEKLSTLNKLGSLNQRQDNWIESAEKSVNFLRNIIECFNSGSTDDKRTILSTLGTNLVLVDGILSIEAKGEYLPIQKGIKQTQDLTTRLKPTKGVLNKPKTLPNESLRLIWLPGLDSNQ